MRGKRNLRINYNETKSEHPRVCGENFLADAVETFAPGTSPRMRGKHLLINTCKLNKRNIPAYAGKTCFEAMAFFSSKEHPRVCGENY